MSNLLQTLAEKYGTPLYVYNLRDVRSNFFKLRSALPPHSRIYYSLKANPHPDLVRCLVSLGCSLEVSSIGEIAAALSSGVSPENVLFTGPAKTSHAIRYAISSGIRNFSVESPGEFRRLSTECFKHKVVASCLIRVNASLPAIGASVKMTGLPSQFGIDLADMRVIMQESSSLRNINIIGIHLFNGSNITPASNLLDNFINNVQVAQSICSDMKFSIREINLGGGFPAPFATRDLPFDPDSIVPLQKYIESFISKFDLSPITSFESGRYLVSSSGSLLTRVVDLKMSKNRRYIILDSGINHVGGMSGLNRMRRPQMSIETFNSSKQFLQASVVGPLCTPADLLSHDVEIPAVTPGDVVHIPNVGAYGLTASLIGFLSHHTPIEIVLDGKQLVSLTRLALERKQLTRPF